MYSVGLLGWCRFMMSKRWVLPAVLLVILLLAFFYRWDVIGTVTVTVETAETVSITFVHDRWAGRVWARTCGVSAEDRVAGELPASHNLHNPWTRGLPSGGEGNLDYMRLERALWTAAWVLLVAGNSWWLCATLRRSAGARGS